MSPLDAPKTLKVDNSVSLSIEDGSCRIVDGRPATARRKNAKSHCCGLSSKRESKSNYQIDLYAILNAHIADNGLTISYVDGDGNNATVNAVQYSVRQEEKSHAESWAKYFMDRAYGQAQPFKRLKVVINPFCGRAVTNFRTHAAPIFAAAHCQVDVEETKYRGHAIEIAEKIDLDAYDAIVCCSGDGLPHEVFNGLAARSDAVMALKSMAVAMVPCGSGNAMAWNVFGTDNPALAALGIVKGLELPLDIASITQGDRHTVSFLSQSLGVLADSDLKTDHLRWMGDHRFIYGVISTIIQKTAYPCEIALKTSTDDGEESQGQSSGTTNGLPLKYGTVLDDIPGDWEIVPREKLASFYASNMKIVAKDTNFFPAALPRDGVLDVMMIDDTVGYAGALDAIIKLPQGKCDELKDVEMRKIAAYRLTPWKQEGYISVDGERYPFEPFQVEVHRGLGRVLSKSNHSYQIPGV
ncbi:hypothetical protein BO71DRAFT_341319 [Aspergillus ellipticus CBS 707.79]|uniref:DAGKc domain-containing protein n=1 Tax=Aspergillus ellipticus CBS 707.79 TaxID=1448320 RepID=A0A319F4P7_9EURO|nr:hypothetical protein BO71DRAFT_341319 [Aspergillus ellipticus CBS 707.79]